MKNTNAAAIAVACLAGGLMFGHFVGHAPISQCKVALEQADELNSIHDETLVSLAPVIGSSSVYTVDKAIAENERLQARAKEASKKYTLAKEMCK